MSPFSLRQNYTLQTYPYFPHPPGCLTPWEEKTIDFLNQVGAAAYFQITCKDKQKHKLNTLNRAGLVRKYQLQGERCINVAAAKAYSLPDLLKTLVFTQLVIRLEERFSDIEILPGDDLLQAVIILNQKPFPVFVLRECDNMPVLPRYERLIIVSETFRPEFKKINIPARIALDEELLSSPLGFYLADGSRETL